MKLEPKGFYIPFISPQTPKIKIICTGIYKKNGWTRRCVLVQVFLVKTKLSHKVRPLSWKNTNTKLQLLAPFVISREREIKERERDRGTLRTHKAPKEEQKSKQDLFDVYTGVNVATRAGGGRGAGTTKIYLKHLVLQEVAKSFFFKQNFEAIKHKIKAPKKNAIFFWLKKVRLSYQSLT